MSNQGQDRLRVERQVHEREALPRLLDHDRIVGVARQRPRGLINLGKGVGQSGIGVETQIKREVFCCEVETSVSIPSALATACSIGVVMKPLMTVAAAPG